MRGEELEICPCCGEVKVELFDSCPVCGWWNDYAQTLDPSFVGKENDTSLNEARAAWKAKQAAKKNVA